MIHWKFQGTTVFLEWNPQLEKDTVDPAHNLLADLSK